MTTVMKIKICGTTNADDALKIAELGANYIGFIFYSKSPRYIKPQEAADIIKKLPGTCKPVGVFVNQSLDETKQIIEQCNLQYVQLHGEESLKFAEQIPAQVIKAFRIKNVGRVSQTRHVNGVLGEPALQSHGDSPSKIFEGLSPDQYQYDVFAYLFDTHVEGLYGGTGQSFNLSLIEGKSFDKPIFLSGGLTPDNVSEAVERIKPYAVDVCSGVEKSPGRKDYQKLQKFIEIATSLHSSQ